MPPASPSDPEQPQSILEDVTPLPGSFDTAAMARGEPGVPRRFLWRGQTYEVVEVLASERELDRDGAAPGVGYVRRHAVTVRTRCGLRLVLVGVRARGAQAGRWTLRSLQRGSSGGTA